MTGVCRSRCKAGLSWLPPLIQRGLSDHLACSSSRSTTARADSIFSASLFLKPKGTTAFWPTTFGGETVTVNCAMAGISPATRMRIASKGFICHSLWRHSRKQSRFLSCEQRTFRGQPIALCVRTKRATPGRSARLVGTALDVGGPCVEAY